MSSQSFEILAAESFGTPWGGLPREAREALVLEMAAGRAENRRDDAVFDRLLPLDCRFFSRTFWSPLGVVAQAALWLAELQIQTVVDIGSGVGKFCIGGALASRSSFIGIEQRAALVDVARGLARGLGVDGLVRFVQGIFDEVTVPAASCYYFFNPFAESLFRPEDRLDEETEVSQARSLRDVHRAKQLLAAAPVGTYVMTYNGFGGTLPDNYEVVRVRSEFSCVLQLARKRRARRI